MMNKSLRVMALLVFLAGAAVAASAQERYLKPVDEGTKDASFAAFRKQVIAAAERRDAKFIYGILDPKIHLSFGGESGVNDFKRIWKLEAKDSKFWDEFLRVMRGGGSFGRDNRDRPTIFAAPYTYSDWPNDIDGFDLYAIFGNNVNLRETPSREGRVLGQLSYNIVKVDHDRSKFKPGGEDSREFEWYYVETLGGKKGYVFADFVRSHVDYRAGFEKKGGRWKMIFFIAGD
jgi:hypothetical protein